MPGEKAIQHIIGNNDQFNLYGRYSVNTNKQYDLPLKGDHDVDGYNLRITATVYNVLGPGVEIKAAFISHTRSEKTIQRTTGTSSLKQVPGCAGYSTLMRKRYTLLTLNWALILQSLKDCRQ